MLAAPRCPAPGGASHRAQCRGHVLKAYLHDEGQALLVDRRASHAAAETSSPAGAATTICYPARCATEMTLRVDDRLLQLLSTKQHPTKRAQPSKTSFTTPQLVASRQQASHAAKRLTAAIGCADGWEQLSALLVAQRQQLNAIHLAAMLGRLARVLGPSAGTLYAQEPAFATFIDALLSATHAQLLTFRPRQLVNSLWALAKLQVAPSGFWLGEWRAALARRFGSCTPQDFALALYSLAALRAPPSPAWTACCLTAMEEQLPGCNPQDLANAAWALATLHLAPPPRFLRALAAAALPQLRRFKLQELSNLAWALGSLAHTPGEPWLPGEPWMRAFTDACLPELQQSRSRAALRSHSEEGSSSSSSSSSSSEEEARRCQALANILWGCAKLGHRPSVDWMLAWEAATQSLLPAFRPVDAASCLWALASLDWAPSPPWQRQLLAGSIRDPALQAFSPEEVSITAWALSRLQQQPGAAALPPEALRALVQAAFRSVPVLEPLPLVRLLAALPRLMPPSAIKAAKRTDALQPLCEAAEDALLQRGLHALDVGAAAHAAWGFAKLLHVPSAPFLDQLLACAAQQVRTATPSDVATLLWASASLYVQRVRACRSDACMLDAWAPSRRQVRLLAAHLVSNSGGYSAIQLEKASWALLRLPHMPWDLVEVLRQRLDAAAAAAAAQGGSVAAAAARHDRGLAAAAADPAEGRHAGDDDGRRVVKLRVSNLPLGATPDELLQLVGAYGPVADAELAAFQSSGKPKGYGFVFCRGSTAAATIAALDGRQWAGRTLGVAESSSPAGGGTQGHQPAGEQRSFLAELLACSEAKKQQWQKQLTAEEPI